MFFLKSYKKIIRLFVVTGLLIVGSGGDGFAATQQINDGGTHAILTGGGDHLSFNGLGGTATVTTNDMHMDNLYVNQSVTAVIATLDADKDLTAYGYAVIGTGSSSESNRLTVTGAGKLTIDGNIYINGTGANFTLTAGAGGISIGTNLIYQQNGQTVMLVGAGDIDLGNIIAGEINSVISVGGSGTISLKGGSAANLTVKTTSDNAKINASGILNIKDLDLDSNALLTASNTVVVNNESNFKANAELTVENNSTVTLGSVVAAAGSKLILNNTNGTVKLAGGSATNFSVQAKADNAKLVTTDALSINTLTVDKGVTGFEVDNGHALTVANLGLGSDDTTEATEATITYSGSGKDSTVDTTLTSATVSGKGVLGAAKSGTLTFDNTSATVDAVHTVQVDSLELVGIGMSNTAIVNVKDTGSGGAAGNTVTNVNITNLSVGDGSVAKSVYGKLETTALAGKVAIETVTLKGTGAGTGFLSVTGDAAGKIEIAEIKLEGATETDDAIFAGRGYADVTKLGVATGKFGEFDLYSSNTSIATTNVDGKLMVYAGSDPSYTWALRSTDVINVGKTGTLEVYASVMNPTKIKTVAGAKIILDLGDDTDTSKYAKVTGQLVTSDANADGDAVADIYAKNGVSGTTYDDVFDTAIQAGDGSTFGDDKLLSTEDEYRVYTLADNGKDVVVSSATGDSSINVEVTTNGGTETAGKAAQYLVDNQASLDAAGQNYTAALSSLSGAKAARAAEETIGEEATVQSTQAALTTVVGATKSVGNQMTSFRSGNLSSGLASSFGSSGATAALDSMVDAETLEDAYSSGYTAAVEREYKKVEVWANGFGGFGEQGTTGDMTGYSFWNAGTMIGFDYALAKEFRVGALVGYSYNKTTVNWHSGNSTDNALRFGAYSSFNWNNFYVDFSPTMGVHMIDSNRYLWNGATAKGERTGIDFNVNGAVGYSFILPYEVNITTSYGLNYTLFNDPEYTETGAGAANVKYKSFTSNSLVQDVGVKVGKLFRVSDSLSFLPEVWGGWEYEYLDNGGERNTTTSASLGAQTYSTEMNSMEQSRGYWGAGVTALINDNVSIYGRYDHKLWYRGFNVSFLAGVTVSF